MKHLTLAFQQHQEDDLPEGVFHGIASAFNVEIDDFGDTLVIDKGAFKKTIRENKERIKVFYNHRELIGKPLEMKETDEGLYVKGQISPTRLGMDVIQLIKDKVLTEMSVGFDVMKTTREEVKVDGHRTGRVLRHFKEVRLWEFSPVPHGRNPGAKIFHERLGSHAIRAWEAFEDAVTNYEGTDSMSLSGLLNTFWQSLPEEQRASQDVQSVVRNMLQPEVALEQETEALPLEDVTNRLHTLDQWEKAL